LAPNLGRVAFVLKGYPRLSETFIAQEIAALERRGLEILIVSLRHPTDARRHPVHDEIRAALLYLPEYLYQEPLRVFRSWIHLRRSKNYREARNAWLRDLARDPTPNRMRRFGQALVLAAELPGDVRHLHAHFLHTPASVARYAALLVLGPFMQPERQAEFMDRAARLKRVDMITFHSHLETLVSRAAGVVSMGGYNTFCEVLSMDKRALIVPRTEPRLEQYIRISRAAKLGLISMLADDGRYDPAVMAAALRRLPSQNRPSEIVVPGLLEGLDNVGRLVAPWIEPAAAASEEPRAIPRIA